MTSSHDPSARSQHVYPASAMVGDYLRAGAGLVPTAAILATVPLGPVGATVIGGFAVIFGTFGARTLLRHGTRLEMTETGLRRVGRWPLAIAWADLDRLKLSYFSTHRDRTRGWMQLELRAGKVRLQLDSRISGFAALVERAAGAAIQRRLLLNATTIANLQQFDVAVPADIVEAAR
jgi:hypothetical protein